MKREIEKRLHKLIEYPSTHSVVIVEGARQVGKSYTINRILKNCDKKVLSFDLEKKVKLRREIDSTEDFEDFKQLMEDQYGLRSDSILFFDEAQESKRLARYVKNFKEDLPDIQVILTGSSMNRFFPKNVRIPVGRYRSICLFGFSFAEFIEYTHSEELADFIRESPDKITPSRHNLLLRLYDDYLKVGGYPESVIAYSQKDRWEVVIDEIMASLEEDFERKEEYQPELFRDTLTGIANHIGNPSKYTHFKTTKYYAKAVINALRKWHIALEVEPVSLNPDKGGSLLPKRYLHDVGVANRMRSMAIPQISLLDTLDPLLRTPLGGLFENSLLIQLLSGESAFHKVGTWKQSGQADIEVDFVCEIPTFKLKVPVECKATLQIKKKHYRNVIRYLNLTNQRFGFVISAAPLQIFTEENMKIINLPIYLASKSNIENYVRKEN